MWRVSSKAPTFLLTLFVAFQTLPAFADNSDKDFRAVKLGAMFDPIINGFVKGKEIAAAPNIRMDLYTKSYNRGAVSNAVGIYKGVAISKLQNSLQSNKAECQQNIVRLVEQLQQAGIGGWKNSWRKDYEVPVYSVNVQFIRAKVTCRMNSVGWFLEYAQALRGERLKKLLR